MGPLPFERTAAVIEQGGAAVAGAGVIAISARPLHGSRTTDVGEAYDWTAEAEIAAAPFLVDQVNRSIVLDNGGPTLKVIDATRHEFLPHVQLTLRQMKPGG